MCTLKGFGLLLLGQFNPLGASCPGQGPYQRSTTHPAQRLTGGGVPGAVWWLSPQEAAE